MCSYYKLVFFCVCLSWLESVIEAYSCVVTCSDIYPFLERICLEGTRLESKFAVSVIASLADSSDKQTFSNLCTVC